MDHRSYQNGTREAQRKNAYLLSFLFFLHFQSIQTLHQSVGLESTTLREDPLFSSSLLETALQTHSEVHTINLPGTFQFNQVNN